MIPILAQVESVFLMSLFKPVLFLALLIGWGWLLNRTDKDAAYYYLPRIWTNLGLLIAGIVGFTMMLLIPFFILGLVLGLMVIVGSLFGYAYFRNTKVPEHEKWTLSLDSLKSHFAAKEAEKAQANATLLLYDKKDDPQTVPAPHDPLAPAHEALENALEFAIPRGADQIDLTADAKQTAMAVRIDGVKYPQPSMDAKTGIMLVDYVKQAAGLDVSDRRKKQSGKMTFDLGDHGRHSLVATTHGSTRGVSLNMSLDTAQHMQMGINFIGLLDSQKQQIKELVAGHGGVVLVSSPAKMGTTTTIYSLTQEHDPYTSSVQTLQEHIASEIEGVDHNQIPAGIDTKAFNDRLAAMLRSDPNVVMIERLRDPSTAEIIAPYAQEIRFYLGIPAEDTIKAAKTWVKAVGDANKAASSLSAVISQRLIRKLCDTCKTAYTPDPAALKKLNLPADRVGELYHSSGQVVVRDKPMACPLCHGIGYRGRIGVFEIMILDDNAKKFLAAGDEDQLRAHLRKHKMLYLQESALAKVVEGVTDIKEVTRALSDKTARRSRSHSSPSRPAEPVDDNDGTGQAPAA